MKREPILILFAALVVSLAIPLAVSAYDINDLFGTDPDTGVFITTERQGLDGYYSEQCRVKVSEFMNLFSQGYIKQLVQDMISGLVQDLVTYASRIALCYVTNFTVYGTGYTGGVGCQTDIGGAAKEAIKRNFMDEVEARFIASCTANNMRIEIGNDIRRVIQENGPDGGPAYVSSWIDDIYIDADEMGIRRFCAILANTDICPYMREGVYAYFSECPLTYLENPPSLTGLGGRVDGGDSFLQRAQCTAGDISPAALSYDFVGYGGIDGFALLMEPQNNAPGLVSMAETELAHQRDISVRAAEADAIAGGGFRSAYGDARASCINIDVNGKCLAYGPIRQPSGGVRDANAAVVQSELDWVVNSKDSTEELVGDVKVRAVSMILDIAATALDYDIEAGPSNQRYVDIGSGIRPPDSGPAPVSPLPGPGDPDPNDPLCTGGNPSCECVRNDTRYSSSRQAVGVLVRQATIQHPDLVQPPGCVGDQCFVNFGSEVAFLEAICEVGGTTVNCHPNAGSVDEVVIDYPGDYNISFDVIIGGTNQARSSPQSVALCRPIGIQ